MIERPGRRQAPDDAPEDGPSVQEWARLVEGCRRQDRACFAELVALSEDRLRRLLARLAGADADVDELLQETYLRAWRQAAQFRGESLPTTWLARIAVNVTLNWRRDRRETVSLSVFDPARSAAISVRQEQAALDAYEEALAKLPVDLRAVFVLHECEGMSYQQVAEALGCPIGTVMSRLHRARGRLLSELRERIGEIVP
jgi:RNA polymerase sigma-70 factor (ECF subfamily)